MSTVLIGAIIFMAIATLIVSPRRTTVDGFFRGVDEQGAAPSLLTLVLSQVTTWIFARSLMNAAILGYYYGIAGTVAYAAYYLSFFTGAVIIDQVRFRHGFSSIQSFLTARHGRLGSYCYNIVVAVRLLSEVFANLIVIGLIFGGAGSSTYIIAVIAMAVFGLGYSMMGGLQRIASHRCRANVGPLDRPYCYERADGRGPPFRRRRHPVQQPRHHITRLGPSRRRWLTSSELSDA